MSNSILDIIKKYKLILKKKYGQNFLIDNNIISQIISAAEINPNDIIIEIGPGLGVLTQFFFDFKPKKIILIEIDQDLINILYKRFGANKNLEIINSDVLKIDLNNLLANKNLGDSDNIKIISNLPYYISTAVITKCLELNKNKNINLKSMIFMVQKEVCERILAKPNNKSYGSLSIFAQYYSDIKIINNNITPNCFLPKPKINSAVIKFLPKKNLYDQDLISLASSSSKKNNPDDIDQDFLFSLVKQAFSKRRKTLVNCLNNFHNLTKQKITDILIQNNLDQNIRAESISINEFINLALKLKNILSKNH